MALNHSFSAGLDICLLSLILLVKKWIKVFKFIFCCYNGNLQKRVTDYFGIIVQKCIYLRNGYHGDEHMLCDSKAFKLESFMLPRHK